MMDTLMNSLFLRKFTDNRMFELLKAQDQFELRKYHKLLCAKIHLSDRTQEGMHRAMKLLYDYTLGHNFRVEKISDIGPSYHALHSGGQEISLVLPSTMDFHEAPKPINKNIKIVELGSSHVGVMKIRGDIESHLMEDFEKTLKRWIGQLGMRVNGPLRIKQNDWAFPLSLFSKSELLIDVAQ